MSLLYLAALVTSFSASKVTRSLGQRWSMLLGGMIFLCGSLVNAAAPNIVMLIIGQFLLGIGVGFAAQNFINVACEKMAKYQTPL
ncbi:hypothetical protein NL676_002014 [Syzygium grande]|nr:hypothetical protein NL676_002014 [Syzygium grande]